MSSVVISGDTSGAITLAAPAVAGTNTLTLPATTGTVALTSQIPDTRFKNKLINSDMRIDQRNAGASVTPATGDYTLDRWQCALTQSSKFTVQQNAASVTPPAGFINYLGVTSSSAYSVVSSDIFAISQKVEGLNIADLGWGTANAKTVTLSFWARSSLTGTFGGSLENSATNRSYPFTYTINSANTWEYETITIAGDTTGTWLTTNGVGIRINLGLGVGATYSTTAGAWAAGDYRSATGATSVVGTSGSTFYITGVQLEVGSSATGFENVDYTTQLAMCQRYAVQIGDGISGIARNANQPLFLFYFPQLMRSSPSATIIDSSVQITDNYSADATSSGSTIDIYSMTNYGGRFSITGYTGLTTGRWYGAFGNGYFVVFSAEL